MPFANNGLILDLLDERAAINREIAGAKGRLSQVETRITELVKPALDAVLEREGKPGGTVKFVLDNHMLKAVIDKRVEWDSDALKEIAASMPPGEAVQFFKVSYSVPEAMFKAVLNPELRAKLTVARVVKYSEPKISLAD